MNAFVFLVDILFTLYLMVILLRIWLQLAKADFYNPISQFAVKATHPVVGPLRRVIPSIGRFDTATFLFGFAIAAAKVVSLTFIQAQMFPPLISTVVTAAYVIVGEAFQLVFYVLILRAILSWVSQGQNPIEYLMHQLTEPLIAPVRRILPPMGGLDLSPMVVIIALIFIMKLLGLG